MHTTAEKVKQQILLKAKWESSFGKIVTQKIIWWESQIKSKVCKVSAKIFDVHI